MKTATLRVERTRPNAQIPRYATAGAACFDISTTDRLQIRPGGTGTLFTGLKFEVPKGTVMLVYSRSGHGFKHGLRLCNSVGVIDSDYRGELLVKLKNDGDETVLFNPGDRVAQAMLVPIPAVSMMETSLSSTERGEGGLGSTGA